VLEQVIKKVPPPSTDQTEKVSPRALVFDSIYDAFRGVVTYVRVVDGTLTVGDNVRLMATGITTQLKEVGIFSPKPLPRKQLIAGQVGYLIGTLKDPSDIQIGDTITSEKHPSTDPLPGFSPVKPMVFSGIYPVDTADYEKCRTSLENSV
jgi:GTP-binding protein LepA